MNKHKLLAMAWLALLTQNTHANIQQSVLNNKESQTCHLGKQGKYITISGIKQWIVVRGTNCQNPIILIVHGGPGSPLSLYHHIFLI